MITTARITHKIHPGISSQVALLVTESTSDLSMTGVLPSNPLFGPYQVFLMLEVGAYMQQVGIASPSPAELIVAFDDKIPHKVIGFLLYQLVNGVPGESAVNYTAVAQGSRGQGIMSAMFREMLRQHSVASLSCQQALVPVYEKLGFRVNGHRETHLTMSVGDPSGGSVATFSGDVSSHPLIDMARQETLKLFGPDRIKHELSVQEVTVAFGTETAKEFAAHRIAAYPEIPQ